MSRLRRRRRLARLLDRAFSARRSFNREWAWLCRDLRDLRAEITTYLTLTPQPKRRDGE